MNKLSEFLTDAKDFFRENVKYIGIGGAFLAACSSSFNCGGRYGVRVAKRELLEKATPITDTSMVATLRDGQVVTEKRLDTVGYVLSAKDMKP